MSKRNKKRIRNNKKAWQTKECLVRAAPADLGLISIGTWLTFPVNIAAPHEAALGIWCLFQIGRIWVPGLTDFGARQYLTKDALEPSSLSKSERLEAANICSLCFLCRPHPFGKAIKCLPKLRHLRHWFTCEQRPRSSDSIGDDIPEWFSNKALGRSRLLDYRCMIKLASCFQRCWGHM